LTAFLNDSSGRNHPCRAAAGFRSTVQKETTCLRSCYTYAWYLVMIDVLVFVGGVGYALYLKSNDRAKYETIGRMVHDGL
jgi:hypothetical protein